MTKKPYVLVCHSKKKVPYVLGRYKTESAAEKAKEHYIKENLKSKELMKEYPGKGIQDLFCDLEIQIDGIDIERMEKALAGPSIMIPNGLSADGIRDFILNASKEFKK